MRAPASTTCSTSSTRARSCATCGLHVPRERRRPRPAGRGADRLHPRARADVRPHRDDASRTPARAPLDIFFGEYLNGSGQVELFQPGYGFGEPLVDRRRCPPTSYPAVHRRALRPLQLRRLRGEDDGRRRLLRLRPRRRTARSTFTMSGVTVPAARPARWSLVLIGAATPNFHLGPPACPATRSPSPATSSSATAASRAIADARNAIQRHHDRDAHGHRHVAAAAASPTPTSSSSRSRRARRRSTQNVVDHFRTDADGPLPRHAAARHLHGAREQGRPPLRQRPIPRP